MFFIAPGPKYRHGSGRGHRIPHRNGGAAPSEPQVAAIGQVPLSWVWTRTIIWCGYLRQALKNISPVDRQLCQGDVETARQHDFP